MTVKELPQVRAYAHVRCFPLVVQASHQSHQAYLSYTHSFMLTSVKPSVLLWGQQLVTAVTRESILHTRLDSRLQFLSIKIFYSHPSSTVQVDPQPEASCWWIRSHSSQPLARLLSSGLWVFGVDFLGSCKDRLSLSLTLPF